MDERVPQGAPAQEPQLEPVAQPVQSAQPAAPQQPTAQSAPAVQPAADLQPAEPQRHYVHHSYIWLGSLRSAGIIIVALGISLFSSMIGSFFEGAGRVDGFIVMVAGLGIAASIVVIFLLCLLYQWWSYKHLWYELGDEEFSLYSGIFNKKRVHVPYQRVQSVDQHASLLQRLFGVCTVNVDTAGGASHTAVTVPYLRKDQAEHLRMELYLHKRRILGLGEEPPIASTNVAPVPAGDDARVPPAVPQGYVAVAPNAASVGQPGNVLDIGAEVWDDVRGVFAGDAVNMGASSYEYGLTNKELILTGLSNNTGFVLALIGVLATVFQVVGGAMDVAGDAAGAVADAALTAGSALLGGNMVLFGIVICIITVAIMWAVSVAGTCIQFGGFKARRRGNRIEVEHGLLQHRIRGVDVDRVQSVIVKQGVIRRLLGYCELSLGKIDATDTSQGDQTQTTIQQGMVIHPFVKVDRVPEILDSIIPEFADAPAAETGLAPAALRRAIIRRGILQGAGFWIAVCVAVFQIVVNLVWHPTAPVEQMMLSYANVGAYAAYAVCLIIFVLEVISAVMWAKGSGFAFNRRFMRVVNSGLGCESVLFPRRKIQFGYTKTNPFQRRAKTATIAARTAAGTGGTTVRLIDVCEDDALTWLDWVRPQRDAVS